MLFFCLIFLKASRTSLSSPVVGPRVGFRVSSKKRPPKDLKRWLQYIEEKWMLHNGHCEFQNHHLGSFKLFFLSCIVSPLRFGLAHSHATK